VIVELVPDVAFVKELVSITASPLNLDAPGTSTKPRWRCAAARHDYRQFSGLLFSTGRRKRLLYRHQTFCSTFLENNAVKAKGSRT
jgi:hypothetical protein